MSMLQYWWVFIPIFPIIGFLIIRRRIAPWLGLGDLRRHTKDGRVSGLGHMIAYLIYSVPTNSQVTKVRLLILTIVLLAPEGSGLFMYIFLWLIIPGESDKEYKNRSRKNSGISNRFSKLRRLREWKEKNPKEARYVAKEKWWSEKPIENKVKRWSEKPIENKVKRWNK